MEWRLVKIDERERGSEAALQRLISEHQFTSVDSRITDLNTLSLHAQKSKL